MPVISAVLPMCPPLPAPAERSGAVLQIPLVGAADALFEAHGRRPAEAAQAAHVHELTRRAVGLGGVPLHRTLVAHDALDERGELTDREVLAAAHVEHAVGDVGGAHVLEAEDHGVADVVDVEELATRRAAAPQVNGPGRLTPAGLRAGPSPAPLGGAARLALVELADERRPHVTRLPVVVVAGAV